MVLPDIDLTRAIYEPDARAVVTVELIIAFNPETLRRASVFIDGEYPRELEEEIYREFRRRGLRDPMEVVYGADADRSYKIVNAADAIACVLFHAIDRRGEEGLLPYAKKRVQPPDL